MEILVSKQALLKSLRTAQNIADKKSTMPILANVLLQTSGDDTLILCATDYVVSMTAEVPCQVKEGGSLSVEASNFCSLIDSMPGDEILVISKQGVIGIKCGRSKYKLRCTPGENYPPLPSFEDAEFYPVDAKNFRTLLEKTMFSVCTDTVRFHLSGVLFESDGDRIRMVSTDGHRLSRAELPQEGSKSEGVIIPKKGLVEIRKALAGTDEAKIWVSPPMMFVSVAALKLTLGIKLIDSAFPNYGQVIPTANDKIVKINRAEAMSAFGRIQFVATDIHGIKLELSENSMKLSGMNPELGQAEEIIDVMYSGEDLALNINPKLVVDYISKMAGEDVTISFSNNMSPVLIHPDDTDYVGVVMPMQPS